MREILDKAKFELSFRPLVAGAKSAGLSGDRSDHSDALIRECYSHRSIDPTKWLNNARRRHRSLQKLAHRVSFYRLFTAYPTSPCQEKRG